MKSINELEIPMVEIFRTVEGEGSNTGYPTTFIRLFGCNLRCSWCDTTYSYAPSKKEYSLTIDGIISRVRELKCKYICLTGGEPLIHGIKSMGLIEALADVEFIKDIHIETGGGIDLKPFNDLRKKLGNGSKIRFILDYKLTLSGETKKMILSNYDLLDVNDEVKFVIGSEEDFSQAIDIMNKYVKEGTVLFSPVWEDMPSEKLVNLILEHELFDVRLNLQTHKFIWHPDKRGV